jgi:hypothetical protein
MSVEMLRRAAAQIRNDHGGVVSCDTLDGRRWLSVADWLDTAGADLWAHGPLCECGSGCYDCDNDLWQPHVRRALAVARAYLGESR